MDVEFSRLLMAVATGEIDDTDGMRRIIRDARTAIAAKEDALNQMRELLFNAQEAFLTGEFINCDFSQDA